MGELRANKMGIHQQPINHLDTVDKKWFAICTKFKCEKYVLNLLHKKNIEAYIPMINRVKRYNRKIKRYQVPLINSYAFVCINQAEFISVLETEYVVKYIKCGKDLLSIPNEEIEMLKKVAGQVTNVATFASTDYRKGTQVEVVSGSLTGMRGQVIAQAGKKSFTIDLTSLQFQLHIDIPMEYLRPLKIQMQ